MEKTWRWFGKKDKITLPMLRQIGVEGVVTALHDVPNGEIWALEAIKSLKDYIESHQLRWSVVESLPVSEAIKYAGPERDQLIENYKVSLANLGKSGIKTVCYNFMPVIDWIRTDLEHPWEDGTSSLYFDKIRFAYFDCMILQREGAIGYATYDTEEEQQRQREAWTTVMRGHAVANGLPVIAVNRVGFEPDPSGQTEGIQFWGSSFVAGHQGELYYRASDQEEESLVVDIDLKHSENVRRWWPFLRDRRIENYGDITRRFID